MLTSSLLILLLVSYLLGAVPFAVLVGRWLRGIDVRRVGSGNTGAMNTLRSAGPAIGVLVFVLDALKAALAMLLGRLLLGPEAATLCGATAVIGHCFSPYLLFASRRERGGGWKMALRRAGGKGLASGGAVLLLIDWRLAVAAIAIFGLSLLILRKDETWPTIIAVLCTTPLLWWLTRDVTATVAVTLVSIVVIVKHLPDLREGFYVAVNHE
jgi:glycerol-3-phosphate acyltransferase PlsY